MDAKEGLDILSQHFVQQYEAEVPSKQVADEDTSRFLTYDNEVDTKKTLALTCSILNFDIAEVWVAEEGGGVRCLYVYATPNATQLVLSDANSDHQLSPRLCEMAEGTQEVQWFTSASANSPLHSDLPINTAIVKKHTGRDAARHVDMFLVCLALRRMDFDPPMIAFFRQMVGAVVTTCLPSFNPLQILQQDNAQVVNTTSLNEVHATLQRQKDLDLGVEWTDIHDLKFIGDGARTSIYFGWFLADPCVVKMVRDDLESGPAEAELENEMDFCQRILHRNVLEIRGAGRNPARFLLLEYLTEGLLSDVLEDVPPVKKTIAAGPGHSRGRKSSDSREGKEDTTSRRRPTPGMGDKSLSRKEDSSRHSSHHQRGFLKALGKALPASLKRRRRQLFPYADVLRFGLELATVLDYLHRVAVPDRTVVHRNVNPDSIGFQRAARVGAGAGGAPGGAEGERPRVTLKLCGFSLARQVARGEPVPGEGPAGLALLAGKRFARYLAPEVLRGEPHGAAADVYSLGLVLWSLKMGRMAFAAAGAERFRDRVVRRGGILRPECSSKWPAGFTELMRDCWHPEPRLRPAAHQVAVQLRVLLQAEGEFLPGSLGASHGGLLASLPSSGALSASAAGPHSIRATPMGQAFSKAAEARAGLSASPGGGPYQRRSPGEPLEMHALHRGLHTIPGSLPGPSPGHQPARAEAKGGRRGEAKEVVSGAKGGGGALAPPPPPRGQQAEDKSGSGRKGSSPSLLSRLFVKEEVKPLAAREASPRWPDGSGGDDSSARAKQPSLMSKLFAKG